MATKTLIWSAVILGSIALVGAIYLLVGAPGLEKAVTGTTTSTGGGSGSATGDCIKTEGIREGQFYYSTTSNTTAAECAASGGDWCPGGNIDACGIGEGWPGSNNESGSCCAIDPNGWCCGAENEGESPEENNLSEALRDSLDCLLDPQNCTIDTQLGSQQVRDAFYDSLGCPNSSNLFCSQGFDPFDAFCLFNSNLCNEEWLNTNFLDLMDICAQDPSSPLCGGDGNEENGPFDNFCVRYPDSELCGGSGDTVDGFFDISRICRDYPQSAFCGGSGFFQLPSGYTASCKDTSGAESSTDGAGILDCMSNGGEACVYDKNGDPTCATSESELGSILNLIEGIEDRTFLGGLGDNFGFYCGYQDDLDNPSQNDVIDSSQIDDCWGGGETVCVTWTSTDPTGGSSIEQFCSRDLGMVAGQARDWSERDSRGTAGGSSGGASQSQTDDTTASGVSDFFAGNSMFSDYNFADLDTSLDETTLQIQFCFKEFGCRTFDSLDNWASFIAGFSGDEQNKYFLGEDKLEDACIWNPVTSTCLYRDSFSYASNTYGQAASHIGRTFNWAQKGLKNK